MNEKQFAYVTRKMSPAMRLAAKECLQSPHLSKQSIALYWQVSVEGLKKALKKLK